MKTSENGVALIKRFEGLELEAYQDIAGIWTIGYGHTETAQPGMTITARQAEDLLRRDLVSRENGVDRAVTVPLNQNEFDALVSFVYNVGINAFRGSTALRRLNRGDRMGAADALTWWNKATVGGVLREVQGLTRRRAAERALFLTPVDPPIVRDQKELDANSRIEPFEDPPRRGSLAESRTVQGASVAGGAGAAASSMGRDSAEELDELETNIENGTGMTDVIVDDDLPPDSDTGDNAAPGDELDEACLIDESAPNDSEDSDPPEDASPGEAGAASSDEDCVIAEIDETGAIVSDDAGDDGMIAETLDDDLPRPSKHELHEVQSQIQLALLILIILSVLYILYARIDDWWNYRR